MLVRTIPWTPEAAFAELQNRFDELTAVSNRANEADMRLKVVDVLLFDVLDWEKTDVDTEHYCRAVGYADYVFSVANNIALVVEAKRGDISFVIQDAVFEPEPVTFALLEKEMPEAGCALRQALGYAASLGARYIAISNGHQWIIALTYVQSQNIEEREVIVFDSLARIRDNFRRYWTCFSRAAVAANEIYPLLMESRKKPAPAKLSLSIPGYPITSERNRFINELSYILQTVWDILSRTENTLLFLENCYVSPQANEHLIAFAKDMLRRRSAADQLLTGNVMSAVTERVTNTIIGYDNEKPFILLGDVGQGKTTFLNYLRLVGARDTLASYIQLEANFLDRPDSASEVNDFIYIQLEAQLLDRHSIDVLEDSIVRGALHSQIERFHRSSRYKLHGDDRAATTQEEKAFIQEQLKDRHSYYQAVIRHLKRGRGRSIAVFFDNLDRRDPAIQEAAFLKASAIARDWECVVFICLRPTTFYQSFRSGVLDSIAPKTFTIGSPDLPLVLKRRFNFAEKLALGEIDTPVLREAMKNKDISFRLPSVAKIFACCEFSARKDASAVHMLAAISNGNVRTLLDLTKRVLTSGHLDTGKILTKIKQSGSYFVPSFEAVKTLLYGDYDQYDPRSSIFVNLFDIYHADPKEHFIRLLMFEYLSRFHDQHETGNWVSYLAVASYLESFYFDVATIQRHLTTLIENGSLETSSAVTQDEMKVSTLRITTRGSYHANNLVTEFQYLDAICIDTPITDASVRPKIVETTLMDGRLARTRAFLNYLQTCINDLSDAEGKEMCQNVIRRGLSECDKVEKSAAANIARSRRV
jgi:hypothetical protein